MLFSSRTFEQWISQQTNGERIACSIISLLLMVFIIDLSLQARHLPTVPGPWWAAYTRLWLVKTLASGVSSSRFVEVNSTYGPLARIGPNHLLTDDPDVTRRILSARSPYLRAPWFDSIRIDPHIPNIVSERDPEKHNRLRARLAAGYAGKDIDNVESTIDGHILGWLRRVNTNWVSPFGNSKAFDIGKRIQFLTVDIITHLCLGEALGCCENDKDQYDFLSTVEIGNKVCQHFSVLLEMNTLIFYLTKLPFLGRYLTPSVDDKAGVGRIMAIVRKAVNKRFEPETQPEKNMLGSFLEKGIAREQVDAELVISLVAGSDTTSTSVQATLLAIILNPLIYQKLRLEIDEAAATGSVSFPIKNVEAKNLPYLQACILEGLRIHPPLTQLRERIVPPEGDVICGHQIPGGTFIGLNAWGTQLNNVFGDDSDIFRPERWLTASREKYTEMIRVQELVFGLGPTRCLGVNIAKMELNKIFFELFRCFDITVANPYCPWKSKCYGIFFQSDFNVILASRPGSLESCMA